MSDENKSQDEHEELNEQELDSVSGGFDPQPDPPDRRLFAEPPQPDFQVRKIGKDHAGY